MRWRVIRTGPADADLEDILRWAAEHFGDAQSSRYSVALVGLLKALQAGPDIPGARRRPALGAEVGSVRLNSNRTRVRHVIYFAIDSEAPIRTIRVLRILHDSMDPARHVASDDPA